MRTPVFVAALFGSVAIAQTAPPPLWTGASGAAETPGADREHAGAHVVGDTLAENASADLRTGRLGSAFDADIQGTHISLPAGTPFVARGAGIPVAVDGVDPPPRPAPRTIVWCALPSSGYAPCFFWSETGEVYAHALMSAGAPSERAWLGAPTATVAPAIVEQNGLLPPNEQRLMLHQVSADGFVLQLIRREGGVEYQRTYRRLAWNHWSETWLAPWQSIRATPIADATGAVTGANIEFTREHAPH